MEDFTLPSVRASFKRWGCCTPILPNPKPILKLPYNTKKKSEKNSKIANKGGQ
jgi:hypothetical protein